MKPEIMFESPKFTKAAFFQCIGGDKPITDVWNNIRNWTQRCNIDISSRRFAGYDEPHPAWCPPPVGYIAFMILNDNEGENGKFLGVHIKEYNTSGLYVCVEVPIEKMKDAWDALFEFNKTSEYCFDTDNRQYFEEHIFISGVIGKDPTNFKIWMPVKKKE